MTTAAYKKAKRLFETDAFAQAIPVLEAIATGSTGDTDPHRQQAEYWLAISLRRSSATGPASKLFAMIGVAEGHLFQRGAATWAVTLLMVNCVTPGILSAVAANEPYMEQWLTQGVELRDLWLFAKARGLFEEGREDEALEEFRRLTDHPRFGPDARLCIDAIVRP